MYTKDIFITGSTGYMGTRLIKKLLQNNHRVSAPVRKGSEHKLPPGVQAVTADPFDPMSFRSFIPAGAIFVQLPGVSHPSPKKAEQFKAIDLRSVQATADAAAFAGVSNFVYVSVAMTPTQFMEAYQRCRREGEQYCKSKGFNCCFLRPWYVLGPGHWWPALLLPLYATAELIPGLRAKTRAFALVTIRQMIVALYVAIEQDPLPLRIVEIKNIRQNRI